MYFVRVIPRDEKVAVQCHTKHGEIKGTHDSVIVEDADVYVSHLEIKIRSS